MARYTISYACGHTCRVDLYGKSSDRLSYINWCKDNRDCPDCKAAADKAAADKEKAEAMAKLTSIPELTGSEKQIAWATGIRARIVSNLNRLIEEKTALAEKRGIDPDKITAGAQKMADAIDKMVETETESRFWIDNRYYDEADILKSYIIK